MTVPAFDALHYVTTAASDETPYAFATLDGLDTGRSLCRARAREHAARICRETQKVVLFLEPRQLWRLTPVSGRAQWEPKEKAA